MTHYIPYFTERKRHGLQLAACNEWVTFDQHRATPECAKCLAWIEADAADLRALQDETPDPSLLVNTERRDMLQGYKPKEIK